MRRGSRAPRSRTRRGSSSRRCPTPGPSSSTARPIRRCGGSPRRQGWPSFRKKVPTWGRGSRPRSASFALEERAACWPSGPILRRSTRNGSSKPWNRSRSAKWRSDPRRTAATTSSERAERASRSSRRFRGEVPRPPRRRSTERARSGWKCGFLRPGTTSTTPSRSSARTKPRARGPRSGECSRNYKRSSTSSAGLLQARDFLPDARGVLSLRIQLEIPLPGADRLRPVPEVPVHDAEVEPGVLMGGPLARDLQKLLLGNVVLPGGMVGDRAIYPHVRVLGVDRESARVVFDRSLPLAGIELEVGEADQRFEVLRVLRKRGLVALHHLHDLRR